MGAKKNNKPTSSKAKPAKAQNDSKQPWWFNQPLPIDRFTGWLVAWTSILSIATLGLIAVALLQWKELHNTDLHIADQLKVMQVGQRAWVTIETVEIDGPLILDGDVAAVKLKIGLRNIGAIPAIRVWSILHLYPGHLFKRFPPDCEAATRRQLVGINLLPNEFNNSTYWEAHTEAGGESTAIPNDNDFGFVVVGCILYESFGDATVHSTGFAGGVFRKDKTNFNRDKIRYQADELSFVLTQGLGGEIR